MNIVTPLTGSLLLAVALGCSSPPTGGTGPPSAAPPVASYPPSTALRLVDTSHAWPVRGRIAFHSDRLGRNKLFVLDLSSRVLTALTSGSEHHDEDASWSRDGRQVAFATTRFDARSYDLAVMNADGTGLRRLTDHLAFDRHPSWTADGRALIFASDREGTEAVYRLDLRHATVTRVSRTTERALMPATSMVLHCAAYVVGLDEGFQVMEHDLLTGKTRRLTAADGGASRPAWSPSGARLAYTRLPAGGSYVEIMDFPSRTATQVGLKDHPWIDEAAWSPDGRWLVVAATRVRGTDEDWDLFLVEGDGPRAYRLTGGHGNDRAPVWIQ